MSSVFTDFTRALDTGHEQLTTGQLEEVLSALRKALIWKLRQRSLWQASPTFLGIFGFSSWSVPEALDELLFDCYEFVFIDRQRGLRAQLEVVDNIDGLILRNINNFLYERQKRHDPMGFRLFSLSRAATRAAIDARELYLLAGSPKVANDTILGFTPWGDPAVASQADLRPRVQVWNDELLPDLITADGKARRRVEHRLRVLICRLAEHGIEAFSFGGLVAPLKADVRERWSRLWDSAAGESVAEADEDGYVTLIRFVRPNFDFEARDTLDSLLARVAEAIEQCDESAGTRNYLKKLWTFLRYHATGVGPPELAHAVEEPSDKLPSHRKMARMLGIPRDRLTGLLATLGELTEACRTAKPRNVGVSP